MRWVGTGVRQVGIKGAGEHLEGAAMDITTILIVVVIILLLGGGWYGRGRWY